LSQNDPLFSAEPVGRIGSGVATRDAVIAMFMPPDPDRIPPSEEDLQLLRRWFVGLFVVYGSALLLVLMIIGATKDTNDRREVVAAPTSAVTIHATTAAMHP
jgi:hypothetical protein